MVSVLSIDFDYFQNADLNVIKEYPDGIDLPAELSTIVWSSKYADPRLGSQIKSVALLDNELLILKELIGRQDPAANVMIASSHLAIYDWIHSKISVGEKFTLHNVDMHHDLFNNNKQVDCGNWVSHIFKDYGRKNVSFRWVVNPITLDMYGFDLDEKSKLEMNISTSLRDLINRQYQYIFLCRSDSWLPPHLDRAFTETALMLYERFSDGEVLAEPSVLRPRNYEQYANQIGKCFQSKL